MLNYLTRQMVARKPLTYLGRELSPGDAFVATPVDAEYFVRGGRAADADGSAPVVAPVVVLPVVGEVTSPVSTTEFTAKPSDGLTVAELKEALTARGIEFPSGYVPKAELAALLDA
jgi:hypothetical protein